MLIPMMINTLEALFLLVRQNAPAAASACIDSIHNIHTIRTINTIHNVNNDTTNDNS